MAFTGKKVVVTGGAGALGTAVVGRLLDLGATVHIPAFTAHEAQRFAHKDAKGVHLVAGVDLGDEAQVAAFYAGVGPLWASIHIAGGFDMAAVLETSAAAFDRQMTMNARTCFLCSREAVRHMDGSQGTGGQSVGGRIVNVSARPGIEPRQGAGMVAYCASKAAVAAMTQAMAEEFAPQGIWVNAVAPSILDTPANRDAMPKSDHAAWPKVEEVAETIVHLASPHNGAARGAVVPVYGRV